MSVLGEVAGVYFYRCEIRNPDQDRDGESKVGAGCFRVLIRSGGDRARLYRGRLRDTNRLQRETFKDAVEGHFPLRGERRKRFTMDSDIH